MRGRGPLIMPRDFLLSVSCHLATSRLVNVLETSPLLSERDSLEVDWHIRISLQEFVILPVKELSRKKRVVRSSLVVMDPAGRRSSQLLA
ncbi:hypothetical protein Tco_1318251 [Tanacetum coccineum]|uniref:Uncharacterized protein n=1 Tax=Tanacetum coccineum TaxID=301880 RepID=A0ABQ4WRU4_9ASTR